MLRSGGPSTQWACNWRYPWGVGYLLTLPESLGCSPWETKARRSSSQRKSTAVHPHWAPSRLPASRRASSKLGQERDFSIFPLAWNNWIKVKSFFFFLTFTELSNQPDSRNFFRASWIVSYHCLHGLIYEMSKMGRPVFHLFQSSGFEWCTVWW